MNVKQTRPCFLSHVPAPPVAADAAPPKFDLDASPQPRHIRLLAEARCEITDLAKRLEEAEQRARVAETLGAADFDAVEAAYDRLREKVTQCDEALEEGWNSYDDDGNVTQVVPPGAQKFWEEPGFCEGDEQGALEVLVEEEVRRCLVHCFVTVR